MPQVDAIYLIPAASQRMILSIGRAGDEQFVDRIWKQRLDVRVLFRSRRR